MSRMEVKRETVDLSELVLEIMKTMKLSEPDSRNEIEIQTGLKAEADPRLVRLMLENLLGNAWKFNAGNDAPMISFSSKKISGETWFVIQDNGAGFDMKYADKLFLPFSRLHTLDEFEGTGIGLAIVDRVIRKHHGDIRAEGKVGKGATFSFRL